MGERRLNKTVFEKVEFIVHKIISGVVLWIVVSVMISYQKYIIENIANTLLGLLLYLMPFLAFVWFINISSNKNQWKPFGSNSNMIGKAIIVAVSIILLLVFGSLKVIVR